MTFFAVVKYIKCLFDRKENCMLKHSFYPTCLALGIVSMGLSSRLLAQSNGSIVISQIYASGGYNGATWKYDFVELFNRSASTVDISTWALQYSSTNNKPWRAVALNGRLQSGQYYLVQFGSFNPEQGQDLPAYDSNQGIDISASTCRFAVTSSMTTLSGEFSGGIGDEIEDFVSYGKMSQSYEGSGNAVSPNLTESIYRLGSGTIDTGDNFADFNLMAAAPRNTFSPFFVPTPEPGTVGSLVLISLVAGSFARRCLGQRGTPACRSTSQS
ncbi:MAG: lamin tail domain-containing protein [Gemmataceae bacterium]